MKAIIIKMVLTVYCLCMFMMAGALPYLHSYSGNLMDSHERIAFLHGVNVVNKQYPYTAQGLGVSESTAKLLQKQGFNIVRLGFIWKAIEPNPGSYNDDYLASMKKTIKILAKHGIYTLIDFHQDAYSDVRGYGLGAPAWATLASSQLPNIGFPLNYLSGFKTKNVQVSDFENQAFDAFWQNKEVVSVGVGVQTLYLNMLAHVAEYFNHNPNIAGFEIMNEPFAGSLWKQCAKNGLLSSCPSFERGLLTDFIKRAIFVIRAVNPKTIIWYEPNVNFGLGGKTALTYISNNNVGFAFHNYCNHDPKLCFQHALPQREQYSLPLLATEFGANSLDDMQRSKLLNLADKYQINWIYWALVNNPIYQFSTWPKELPGNPNNQGLVKNLHLPLKGSNVKWKLLGQLTRPYPQFVAGANVKFSVNPVTHRFDLSYVVEKIMPGIKGNISVIYLPTSWGSRGYKFSIRGAKVISRSNCRLKVKNQLKSHQVKISISSKS